MLVGVRVPFLVGFKGRATPIWGSEDWQQTEISSLVQEAALLVGNSFSGPLSWFIGKRLLRLAQSPSEDGEPWYHRRSPSIAVPVVGDI